MQQSRGVHLSRGHMFLIYAAAPFSFGVTSMMTLLVPFRAQELGAPLEIIGIIAGIGLLGPAFFSVTSGAMSDRYGSRRTYIASTIVTLGATILFAITDNYWLLIPWQVIAGVARNAGWVAAQTYVTGVGTPLQRASITGRFSFCANIGPFVGPLVAGQSAALFGYRTSFLTVALVVAIFVLASFGLAEIDRPHARTATGQAGVSSGFGAARGLMRIRGIQVMLLLTIGRLWVSQGWAAFFPLYLAGQGLTPDTIGAVIAVNGAASTVISLAAGPLSRRASDVAITALALGLSALGTVVSPFITSIPLVFIPSIAMGMGSGITLPLLMSMVGESSPPGQRGVGLGLRNSANSLAGGVAPMTTGALVGVMGLAASLAVNGALTFVLIGAALTLHRWGRNPRPAPSVSST